MAPIAPRNEVIHGVRDLAMRRGWSAVQDLATHLLSAGSAEPLLLAPGGNVDAVPLRAWMQQVTARERIAQVDLARLAAPPHPALFADKLIAAFECGRLLAASEVRTLMEQFRPRPLETFAIVFTRAERLETPEDLDLAERAIWRVLGPGPGKDWRGQDLLGCQCYLWSSSAPRAFLRERCNRDRSRLATLLRRPTAEADATALEQLRVIRLLELATAHCSASPKHDDTELVRLQRRRDDIARLRRRLARRLEDCAFEIGRAAVAALLKSQGEIVQCLEATCTNPTAARNAVRALSIGPAERPGCPAPLEAALHAWRRRLEAELNDRIGAIAADARALLQQVQGEHGQRLAAQVHGASIDVRLPSLQPRTTGARPGSIDGWFAAEIAAAGLLGITALTPGMFAAFIVSSVLSASVVVHRRDRTLEHSRRLMRLAVHDVSERAVPEVRAAVQAAIGRYGERLSGALRQMEAQIEAACEVARRSRLSPPRDVSDRRQLLEYRCRL